jgi:hypothetical protein
MACLDLNVQVTGWTVASTGTIAISGNMNLTALVTWTGTGTLTYNATTSKTVKTSATSFACGMNFNGVAGTWTLQDNLTLGAALTTTLTNGTLALGTFTLSTGLFSSSNANTRVLSFGTGAITLTAQITTTAWTTATVTGLTVSGTPIVNTTGGGATTKTINTGALSEANSISFNLQNSAGTVLFTAANVVKNLTLNGAFTLSNIAITIYGNLTYTASTTLTAGANAWTFGATSSKTITSSATLDFPLTFNGVAGTWVLGANLTMGSTRTLTHTNGTIDLNGKTLTVGTAYTTATGTKNLTFNAGTLICPTAAATAFNNAVPTGYTTTAGTGTGFISMTAATAKTFVGGGSTFNCTLSQDGAGALTITGSNTFGNIRNTTQPVTVSFTAATTTTFLNGFALSGTAGNLVTINSATAATHTLSKASGTISGDYLSITNSIANSGALWYAGTHSTNVSGNTGWIFTAPNYGLTALNGTYAVTGEAATIVYASASTAFVTDTFTDTNGTALTSHTGELGATWTYHTGLGTSNSATIDNNEVYATAVAIYYPSGTPTSADYSVSADITCISSVASNNTGIAARLDAIGGTNFYRLQYAQSTSLWNLDRRWSGGNATLGTYSDTGFTAGVTRTIKLQVNGSTISAYIDGTLRITGTDANITAAGHPGLLAATNSGGSTATTGFHTQSFNANNPTSGAYTVTALNGTYAITGQSAALTVNRVLTANNGTYAVTGKAATVAFNRVLTATNGTYAVTGKAATLTVNRVLSAANGTYAVTGKAATLTVNRVLTASSGTYAVTGQLATITYTTVGAYVLTALSGTYAVTGQTATIGYAPVIIIDDTHDGDYQEKKFKKEQAKAAHKRADIVQAYEQLVEGRPNVAEEIAAPYLEPPSKTFAKPTINYDKLLADTDRAEKLWRAYLEMDDEEVLLLL